MYFEGILMVGVSLKLFLLFKTNLMEVLVSELVRKTLILAFGLVVKSRGSIGSTRHSPAPF